MGNFLILLKKVITVFQPLWNASRERKNILIIIFVSLVIISLSLVSLSRLNSKPKSAQAVSSSVPNDQRAKVQSAKAIMSINKELQFPIRDADSSSTNKFKYTIENAELRDEIIVKGQKATAVQGKTFLIINIKIKNESNKRIALNTTDYIRLSVNGQEGEWLAPDIHNDPVEIQPISTKYTRIGFPINDTDTNLKLQMGEINGEKSIIDLKFN